MIHKLFYQIIHFFHQMDEDAFSDIELLLNLKRRRFNILFLWKCIKLSEKDTYCMNILILLFADEIWKKKLKNVESILCIYICFAHFDVDFAQLSLANDAKVSSVHSLVITIWPGWTSKMFLHSDFILIVFNW